MAKNSMTSIKIGIDNQIAVQKLEELRNKVNTLSDSLLKLNEKLKDPSTWGPTDTKNTIEAQITETSKKLAKATRDYEHIVTRVAGIDDMLANISGASYNTLTRLRTTLTNTLKTRKRDTEDEIKAYEETAERLQKVRDEIAKRDVDVKGGSVTQKAEAVLSSPTNYSTSEIKDAIKTMELLRSQTQINTTEWHKFNNAIKNGQEFLDRYNSELKETAMTDKLSTLATASTASLSEQKKYWQEMANGAEQGSAALVGYQQNLAAVTAEEQKRIQLSAQQTIADVELGNWDKTIAESKEAVKQLQQYRDTLKDTDKVGLEQVDKAIEELNKKLKNSDKDVLSLQDALRQANNLKTFNGTIQDLENLKKRLQEIRQNEIQLGGPNSTKNIKEIDEAISDINVKLARSKGNIRDFDKFIDNIDSASLEELEQAAKQLEVELRNTAQNADDFAKKSAQLRTVGKEIDDLKKKWEDHDNIIVKTSKRLTSYVLVYAGFNQIKDKIQEIIQLNLRLSDSMADVQKTTGLAGVELQELGKDIERIDSRTSTDKLYEIAAAAGQIGLKTQQDVLGFTKAANTITVALNELGTEGAANLMKIATLTGDIATYGTEQSLLKIGSAINELTANSAATAGPITDFINRVGGIAGSAKITVHEMAALGAATDASAQSVEIAGTSMNKFITALMSNTEDIAYAANISHKELQTLINDGQTMQAVIRVLESMSTMSRAQQSAVMKELGSEGARMNQYVATLVSNLDMLKRQLNISRDAFNENTSVINEYNVKQESAMGILERMKNSFLDMFVNSRMTEILKGILTTIAAIPSWLEKHRTILLAIKIIIAEIIAFRLPLLLHTLLANLSTIYKLLSTQVVAAISAFAHSWTAASRALAINGVAVAGLTGKLRILWVLISKHPIGILISVVTAAYVAYKHFTEQTDKLKEATDELNQKHAKEQSDMDILRKKIEGVNIAYQERVEAMKQINSMYSKYLGFELSELEIYSKKSAALDYINAKLKENQEIELHGRRKEVIEENQGKTLFNAEDKIVEKASEELKMSTIQEEELRIYLRKFIEQNKGDESIYKLITPLLKKFGSNLVPVTNKEYLFENYFKAAREYYSAVEQEDERHKLMLEYNQNKSNQELLELKKTQETKIAALEKEGNKNSEAEQIAHLQTIRKEQEEYLQTLTNIQNAQRMQDEKFLASNTYDNQSVDVGNIGAKYGETARKTAKDINKVLEELGANQQQQLLKRTEIEEAQHKLSLEQEKENNDDKIQEAKDYLNSLKAQQGDLVTSQQELEIKHSNLIQQLHSQAISSSRAETNKLLEETRNRIESIDIQIAGDPYSKGLNVKDWKTFGDVIENIDTANINSLVSAFKKLKEDSGKITADVMGFNKLFGTDFESQQQAQDQVFNWLSQLRKKLKSYNRGTTGEVIFGNAKQEFDAAMSSLETHFIKRQALIRENYLKGAITGEEMNRQIEANDQELLNQRVELKKELLEGESNFNQALYPELDGKDLSRIRMNIATLDEEVVDELEKSLAKDEDLLKEGAVKIRQSIEKEFLKIDIFESLGAKLKSQLDKIGLLTSEAERDFYNNLIALNKGANENQLSEITEEKLNERLEILKEVARKSYTVDAEGLRKMLGAHEEYYNWIHNLDDEQMNIMLNQLRWFYDQELITYKNYTTQLKKELDSSYNQQGLKLGEVGRLEWNIDQLKDQMINLDPLSEEYKAREQLINEMEEKLADARKKAADKVKSYRSKQERETKEQYEASISALQAYYNEQEAVIREKAINNNWTQAQLDRELRKNMLARERDLIELRKLLLGELSEFDPMANEGYKGAITGHVFFGDAKSLNKQKTQIARWGSDLMDGMRNQIAKGSITIQEATGKLKDNIEKILLEDDFTGKVAQQYLESIDELGLLFNVETEKTDISKEESKARLIAMQDYANRSYSLTAKQLEDEMLLDKNFSQWRIGRKEKDYEALLSLLRKFHDDQEEADRKAAERRKKIMENSSEGRALTQKNEANIRSEEGDVEMWDRFKGMGLVTDDTVDRAQIDVYYAKIAASQAWIEQIEAQMATEKAQLEQEMKNVQLQVSLMKLRGEDTSNLEAQLSAMQSHYISLNNQQEMMTLQHKEDIADSEQEIINRRVAMQQRNINEVQKYTDALTQFAYDAAYAEEDADTTIAEARNQLIASLLTSLKDWAQMKLTELTMNALFASQRVGTEASAASAEMGITEATTTAEVTAATAKATAKEVATKGLIGLAVGAVIGAALNALLGLALGKLKKSQSEVASIGGTTSGSGRPLAAGMLTYAVGNYPVLGNDGNVYNAKYEGKNIKTGVYGGGAHFGIFSEKQPEAIIDGKTTKKLILNYPEIWKSIVTLSRVGRIERGMGMRTFNTGNIQEIAATAVTSDAAATAAQNEATLAMMNDVRALMAANAALMNKLATDGVKAGIDMYGNGGMYKSMEKASKFAKRRKY